MQKKTSRRCHLAICGGNTAQKEKEWAVPYVRSNILVPKLRGFTREKGTLIALKLAGK